MRFKTHRALALTCLAAILMLGCPSTPKDATPAAEPAASADAAGDAKKFTVAWSIYVGWMPWDHAGSSGILNKWADKYGIEIELVRLDYGPSIDAYVGKQVDAVVMTNMDCLNAPAASGVDSTVVIVGDYSNGNDAILTRGGIGVADLAGETVSLVELSVSHYLLARALEVNGVSENDVTLQNTSDADIGAVFLADESQRAVVTWNPIVMEIEKAPGVDKVFTSAEIPGEIVDLMIARTEVLQENPDFGRALVGAWYEVMELMSRGGADTDAAIAAMAEASGTDAAGYTAQLATTKMFYTPQEAVDYATSDEIKERMDFVRKFSFEHGMLGEGVSSEDAVGVAYPDGTVQGAEDNVKMRFDVTYMREAAAGGL